MLLTSQPCKAREVRWVGPFVYWCKPVIFSRSGPRILKKQINIENPTKRRSSWLDLCARFLDEGRNVTGDRFSLQLTRQKSFYEENNFPRNNNKMQERCYTCASWNPIKISLKLCLRWRKKKNYFNPINSTQSEESLPSLHYAPWPINSTGREVQKWPVTLFKRDKSRRGHCRWNVQRCRNSSAVVASGAFSKQILDVTAKQSLHYFHSNSSRMEFLTWK